MLGCAASKTVPEAEKWPWDGPPLGLETAAPCQPRAAQALEGSEKRWKTPKSELPAPHREAERDSTGK
jgi:hypothetical protein